MENELNNQVKTATTQYDLTRKQLNTLRNTYNQTNEKLLSIQTSENNVIVFDLIHIFHFFCETQSKRNAEVFRGRNLQLHRHLFKNLS